MPTDRSLAKQFDTWLSSKFKPDEPGISVVVVRDGNVVFRNGYGMANVELGIAIKPEMVFRLGSITKQFTAVAILMLLERGKLALTDRITKFIPRYPTQGHKITIEHLLTHTSGIKSYTELPEFWKDAKEDKSLEEHIAFFKDLPMAFKPNERWDYNNSGYYLLGAIIEKASGQTYEAFLKQHVFDRLGMANTHYDMPNKIIAGRVQGYDKGANGIENKAYISMTRPYAAGSLASSVDDLAKWDAALYTNKLLRQSTLKQAWMPHKLKNGDAAHYGYGWGIHHGEGTTLIEHGGGINGFVTHAIRVPEQRLFVAVLANSTGPALGPDFVASRLVLHLLGKPYREPEPIPLSKSALTKFVGQYKIGDHTTITISRKAKHLFIQFRDGMTPLMLIPVAPNEFAVPELMSRLRFLVDAAGAVREYQYYDRGLVPEDIAVRVADSSKR